MSRSRKKKKLTAAREARRLARKMAGQLPSARIIPDKRRKPPRHKKQVLEDQEY